MRGFDGRKAETREGLLRFNSRGTNSSQPTATTETNLCTATMANPINGRTYRVTVSGIVQTGTAGAYTLLILRHALGAGVGGTEFGRAYKDHRVAGRSESVDFFSEFTYTGTTGASPYNVVVTMSGGNGTSTSRGDLMPMRLVVDEIL